MANARSKAKCNSSKETVEESHPESCVRMKAVAYPIDEEVIFEAAEIFLQCEGWLIAPESSYAVRAAVDEALKNEKTGQEKVICMNISGHGFLDIPAYRERLSSH